MRRCYPVLSCLYLLILSLTAFAQTPQGSDAFTLRQLSTYATGVFDEGAAEIVAFDPGSQQLFFTNADANTITILDISDPALPTKAGDIDLAPFGGSINSVAVREGIVAAAIAGPDVDSPGMVAFFDTDGGTLGSVTVGVLPDMIVFSPDGSKVLTADEGEPSDDYTIDPLGTVSIIDVSGGIPSATVTTLDFSAYNDRRQQLINQGVRIFGPGASVAQDLEPEYITIAEDSLAYVTLQENNALAIVNINTAEIVDIKALGFKDHSSGQPQLTEYVLNELTTLPDLGTPAYGGGQPTVKLGGFSGLYYDAGASAGAELVFYAVPDRGPNDGPVNPANLVSGDANTNLRPFKLPDYQGRIARFTVNTGTGAVTLDEQILLTRQDGTTPITGRGNIPGFDETPVVPADPTTGLVQLLNEDFEDGTLGVFTAVSVASDVDWEIRNFSGSDNYAEMNGFSADVASDDWLISPEMSLVTATGSGFRFESTSNFSGPDLEVLVSTDYAGDPTIATWTDLTDQANLSPGNNQNTMSGDISLDAFLGETIHLAFRYTSTAPGAGGGQRWQVDDVLVIADAQTNDFVDTDGNAYNALAFDAFGGDFESVVRDANGNFWMCDEYRPAIYAFTPAGVLIERYVPAGTSQLGSTPQPAGTYGAETLPAVYAKRRANRGFEGMALNTDDGLLYAFIQTPLYNPDNSTRNASDVIRVLAVDPADGSAVAEYVYLLENNANRAFDVGRVDKIGDVVYAGNGTFYVLERDSSVPGQDEGKKYVFSFTLTGATDIRNLAVADEDGTNGMTLEEMSADDLVAAGIQPVAKTKVLNLPSIGYLPSDKPEGLAVLPDGSLAVLNDNDFGLAGAGVSDNSTLGIISFGDDNGFDASNDDGVINITNHPTLGMYQPDAIASYTVDGATYIVSANEGDARDYDAYSEETRVSDLTLDPTAFPDAATLQDDANLGRLRTTDALGDLDGDGDFDQIYSYGARSFSIFDRYGNLVFDSGNEFELVTAAAIAEDFNSNNDENDSFDSRSDDKGPEPEAVEIVTRGNNVYALIGLERVGGIIVYDITDPRAPFYVSYVNNRDFSVDAQLPDDSSNSAAGDLGVEDVVYIPAADSPDGEALVVTANEVSGTISLFGVNRPVREPLTLRILHNNDGESKIVADTLDDGRPFGGADRFLTVLEDLRDDGVASVTLSSGDNYLPGKAFNASLARPAGSPLYDSEVLNAIGYDALVIGNHDFDFGPDILQRVVEETAPSGATFLSANLDFSAEPGLQALVDAGRIAKSEIVEVAGQPIGVIGLTTTSLPTISTPRGVEVDSNLVAIAQGEIDSLTGLGVSKIILISHLQDVDEEIMLAGQLEGIDVIIAGGGDELLTNDPANALGGLTVDGDYPRRVQDAVDSTVYIVTTPGEYRYVGNLTVDFDEDGFITGIDEDSDIVPVVGDITGDPAITPIVDSINVFVADLAANIIATTEVDLDGLRASVRTIETNQGNLITDAYLWFFDEVSDQFDFDPSLPVVAVQNGGGIRDDEVIPAGSDISEEKTFDILPFSNFVSVLEPLTPTELKSALENSVSRIPDRNGRFLQVAGFELVYDTIGTPDVSRVIEVTLDDGTPIVRNGTVLADAPSVYVVTNSFTADGGDDYDEFGAKSFVNIGPSYQRVLFDYLVAEDGVDGVITAEQYPAGGEGRIRLVGDNQPLTLRILHNNDGESKIVADTLDDGRPFGGADRFLTVLEDLRDDDVASVTLSSGDNYLPGKAFNASLARPAGSPLYDSEVLNAIGYDALVIGNHDFDFGPDILQRVVEETAPSGATFLSANLDFSAEPGLQALVDDGRIAKSEVVLAGDQLIGVIGLTTISLPTISTPRGVEVDSNLVAIAQGEIDSLTNLGINKIILISHLQDVDEEIMLAGQLEGIDVIIAGGGDELLTNDPSNALGGLAVDGDYPRSVRDAVDSTVYIVTTPGEYRYVGNLTVDFDADGFITGIDEDSDVVPVVGDIDGDPAITPIVDSINLFVEDLAANIIATTEVDLDGLRASVRTIETNQGNLITDAYLWFFDEVSDQFDFDASLPVIAVQNGGGIRDDEVIPAGSDISEEKTFDILPFSNFVSVLEPLTPTELKSALENSVSRIPDRNGRFLQVAGFEVVYDPEGTPDADRIVSVTLDDGTPIVADRMVVDGAPSVYVVTNSFTADGGDDYDEFGAKSFVNIGPSYQRVLFDYLVATNGVNGVITAADYPAGGEGRIRIFDNCPAVPATPAGSDAFELDLLGSYSSGVFDEGAAEIVAHDPASQQVFFTNANANSIGILDITDPAAPTLVTEVSMDPYGGGVNSVAVANSVIAVAVEGNNVDDAGTVVFLDTLGAVTGTATVGVLPDMLLFSPDGTKVLTANEGQPDDDYLVDPEGSVSIVNISGGVAAATVTTVGFAGWNDSLQVLLDAGVRIFGPDATVAQDLEPEYITIEADGNTAYVVFQENNALGVIDLTQDSLVAIVPLGFKDHSCDINGFDPSNRDDAINIGGQPTLGMYQPDAITSYVVNGTTYLVTANEGDARDYDGFSEEARVADLQLDPTAYPNASTLQQDSLLGRLLTTTAYGDTDGDGDIDQIYSYGARSFSIWNTAGELVYDSGSEFERLLAEFLPDDFNGNNDENDSFDSRSDDKGPEPEAVTVVTLNDTIYALVGLERVGGVMVYDITDPTAPAFVSYTNNRDFSVEAQLDDDSTNPEVGDLGIEDIIYIEPEDSPNGFAIVVTANEVSGTVSLFGVNTPPVSTDPELNLAELGFRAIPNPFQRGFDLRYELPAKGQLDVQLTDVTGRPLRNLWSGKQTAGQQTLRVDLANYPAGMYFVRVRLDQRVGVLRVVKQ